MIHKLESIPIGAESYPFASAEKYCQLSQKGYTESEYSLHGTANVYRTKGSGIAVESAHAPYVNRLVVRAPQNPALCSGNVVVEIINPTSFMEIDRLWILGHRQFMRSGDIYVGITSKPNTLAKLVEFDAARYGRLSWKNPMPEKPFPFTQEDLAKVMTLPDQNLAYEPGLFWDMLSDLAWLLRSNEGMNPVRAYPHTHLYLTGWSQSAGYALRYINDFAYRPEVARGGCVFDGYLAAGAPKSFAVPLNQYETALPLRPERMGVYYSPQPLIQVQTESENGRFMNDYDAWSLAAPDSDAPHLKFRLYEITGASHDTLSSYVNYYQNDPDLLRINHLPVYCGKEPEANDYPSNILMAAAFRNLFQWVRTGAGPARCTRIPVDELGRNQKDVFGNTRDGMRTCLLNCPTGRFYHESTIEKGQNFLDAASETDGLFGHQEAFSAGMLKELYGSLENYARLAAADTATQVAGGLLVQEDAAAMVAMAVDLAKKRGLQ